MNKTIIKDEQNLQYDFFHLEEILEHGFTEEHWKNAKFYYANIVDKLDLAKKSGKPYRISKKEQEVLDKFLDMSKLKKDNVKVKMNKIDGAENSVKVHMNKIDGAENSVKVHINNPWAFVLLIIIGVMVSLTTLFVISQDYLKQKPIGINNKPDSSATIIQKNNNKPDIIPPQTYSIKHNDSIKLPIEAIKFEEELKKMERYLEKLDKNNPNYEVKSISIRYIKSRYYENKYKFLKEKTNKLKDSLLFFIQDISIFIKKENLYDTK